MLALIPPLPWRIVLLRADTALQPVCAALVEDDAGEDDDEDKNLLYLKPSSYESLLVRLQSEPCFGLDLGASDSDSDSESEYDADTDPESLLDKLQIEYDPIDGLLSFKMPDSKDNSGLDELANIRFPFSDLREFLRVAVQNAIRDRDIPEDDTLEGENELETSGHTRAPSDRFDAPAWKKDVTKPFEAPETVEVGLAAPTPLDTPPPPPSFSA
ncbi:hypothetical protein QIS74_04906 [Colletotrichum tabaci]|uniref:Uncharacterized protein n=1 Tax=Colletotrichum tabaci TaxID=1209068 RepID=A0AAV9TH15_9PEZI